MVIFGILLKEVISLIGVIDVGGGLRGIYGAGVFDICLDNNINFDYGIGVSAGSANIASFLGKQKGRNLKFYSEYIFRKEYMSFHNLFRNGSYIDLDYVYSWLSNSNCENPLNYDGIIKSNSIFKIVATNSLTGDTIYFDKSSLSKDDYDVFKASCCIPIVCKPYTIDGINYFDGGLSDPLPIKKAINDGCDKIVLILTKPVGFDEPDKTDRILAKLLNKTYPIASQKLLNRHKKYNEGIEIALKYQSQNKALIIAPADCCGVNTLTKKAENLLQLYNKGYKDSESLLSFIKSDSQAIV